ncbi:hypothetical protein Tco_1065935 [Tanacetum coccineum]
MHRTQHVTLTERRKWNDDSHNLGKAKIIRNRKAALACTYTESSQMSPMNVHGKLIFSYSAPIHGVALTSRRGKKPRSKHSCRSRMPLFTACLGTRHSENDDVVTAKLYPSASQRVWLDYGRNFLEERSDKIEKVCGGIKRKLVINNQAQQKTPKKQGVAYSFINRWPGERTGGTRARGIVHALGGGEINQDLNKMEDDINA